MEFNTILYENEFQNPKKFQQTSLFPEHSTEVKIKVIILASALVHVNWLDEDGSNVSHCSQYPTYIVRDT
jgi:hypothetical protein